MFVFVIIPQKKTMLFLTFSEVWGNELCKRFVSFLCCALTSVFLPSFLGKLVLLSSGLTPSSEWWPIKAASKSRNAWKFTTATSDLDIASSANSCKCSFDFGIIQNGLHFQRIASFFACKQFLNKEKKNDFQSTFDNNKKYRLFASISCSVSILILSKQITIYNISFYLLNF